MRFRRKPKQKLSSAELHRKFHDREKRRQIQLVPPEGVPVGFERASVGARYGAQFLDLLITYGGLVLIIVLLLWAGADWRMSWETFVVLFSLLTFFMRIPYYILTELVWNGRTLGKRILRIKAVSVNGRTLEPHQVVARNLMKEAEVFFPLSLGFGMIAANGWLIALSWVWLIIVLLVPVLSKRNQRLGDMIAGTVVIHQPKVAILPDLAQVTLPTDEFEFEQHHLEHYGKFELQTLETILREKHRTQQSRERDVKVMQKIRKKIGYAPVVKEADGRQFMMAFYRAQRAYLEGRALFGDTREDKFHND